ncbi:hypothetical protein NLX86_18835 [Streptomyces sp. A3M-1-3]|nr:hypothetical protein [Streptomyces sp. A3M-1-3]
MVKLLVLEVLFTAALLAGVALVHVPAALVLGGVLGVVACERASSRRAVEGRRGGEGGER